MYDAGVVHAALVHQFTGKERDGESNLDYFGARYYSSSLGRFMSPDPDGQDAANPAYPQTWNMYSYVRNNPLNAVDPDGRACVTTDSGKTYHDDNSGGQSCKEAFSKSENNAASAVVEGKGASAPVAFAVNFGISLDNLANNYFAPVLGGYRPSYMRNTETGSGLAANLGAATAIVGTALIGPEGEAESGIRITEGALEHIAENHMVGGVLAVPGEKSVFSAGEDVKALIQAAEGVTPVRQAGGNFQRVVDAGRTIGIDRSTGVPTSIYTVITRPNGSLVTAFPGKP